MPPRSNFRKRSATTTETPYKRAKPSTEASEESSSDGALKFTLPSTAKAPRFVTLDSFKGQTLIGLREYYVNASGETLPGKKGISLKIDQWRALMRHAPEIEKELKKRGEWLEYGSEEERELEEKKKEAAAIKGTKASEAEKKVEEKRKGRSVKSKEIIDSDDEAEAEAEAGGDAESVDEMD